MKKLALIVLALIASIPAFAAGKNYGAAGCGLGNVIFGKESQILAATTNGSSNTQLFGITSGTSNCTDGAAMASASQLPVFVEANRMALATDAARGSGETVANLSQAMGCNNAGALATTLQKNYSKIFSNKVASSEQVAESIKSAVKSNSNLSCSVTI